MTSTSYPPQAQRPGPFGRPNMPSNLPRVRRRRRRGCSDVVERMFALRWGQFSSDPEASIDFTIPISYENGDPIGDPAEGAGRGRLWLFLLATKLHNGLPIPDVVLTAAPNSSVLNSSGFRLNVPLVQSLSSHENIFVFKAMRTETVIGELDPAQTLQVTIPAPTHVTQVTWLLGFCSGAVNREGYGSVSTHSPHAATGCVVDDPESVAAWEENVDHLLFAECMTAHWQPEGETMAVPTFIGTPGFSWLQQVSSAGGALGAEVPQLSMPGDPVLALVPVGVDIEDVYEGYANYKIQVRDELGGDNLTEVTFDYTDLSFPHEPVYTIDFDMTGRLSVESWAPCQPE